MVIHWNSFDLRNICFECISDEFNNWFEFKYFLLINGFNLEVVEIYFSSSINVPVQPVKVIVT